MWKEIKKVLNFDPSTGSTETFDYDGHLMIEAGSVTLNWDENGNMENLPYSGVTSELIYNWDNKLRSATNGTKSIDSIKYDPDGNRIFKDSSETGQRKFIVDVTGELPGILMEINNSGGIVKTYIYANSQIIAQHDGSHTADRYFYLHDRLGSVRQMIDTSGNVVKLYTYEPFGEVLETDGTLDNGFMFTGQYYDTEISQYYLRARQYDPYIGRFTSRDTVKGYFREPMTLHAYLYCLNDPTNKIDVDGEFFTLIDIFSNTGILASLRKMDYKLSMGIWDKSLNFAQAINMIQIDRAVQTELLMAEFEGGLRETGLDAIVSFITPFIGKISPALGEVAQFGAEFGKDIVKGDIKKVINDPSLENFWLYFWGKLPGTTGY